MNDRKIAIFPGSFDPLTKAHLELLKSELPNFDEIIIAVTANAEKKPMFSLDERVAMIVESVKGLSNIRVGKFENKFAPRFAREVGAMTILYSFYDDKSLRQGHIFDCVCKDIDPDIHVKLVEGDKKLSHISSALVRGLVGADPNWERLVRKYVPYPVYAAIASLYFRQHYFPLWTEAMMPRGGFVKEAKVLFGLLIQQHLSKDRWYHTLFHLEDGLKELEACDLDGFEGEERQKILAAWFLHDYIQVQTMRDNEEKSAIFAEEELPNLGFDQDKISEIAELIRATDHKRFVSATFSDLLVDIDLAIFGQDEITFDNYEKDIFDEYSPFFTEGEYKINRKAVLKKFLDRDHIYQTPYFQEKYEDKARENLTRAFEKLKEPSV